MKRSFTLLALAMVALYVTLAIGGAACLVDATEHHSTAHHHHSHVAHSIFCAWACQANPTVTTAIHTPPEAVFHLVALSVSIHSLQPTGPVIFAAHPRAPPSI
jgi:hypothetical protein